MEDERSNQSEMVVDALSVDGAAAGSVKTARVLASIRDGEAVLAGALNVWNTSLANRLVRRGDDLP